MEDNPFSGPYEDGWRLKCPREGMHWFNLLTTIGMLGLSIVLVVVAINFWTSEPFALYSFVMGLASLASSFLFLYLFYTRVAHPARVLELAPDCVMLFEKGRGRRPVVDIPYTRDVEVDVYVRDDPNWKGHMMLVGWTFRKGGDHLRLHPDENWDLWQLQDLERPILWLVERYGMRMGEDLERYVSQDREPIDTDGTPLVVLDPTDPS